MNVYMLSRVSSLINRSIALQASTIVYIIPHVQSEVCRHSSDLCQEYLELGTNMSLFHRIAQMHLYTRKLQNTCVDIQFTLMINIPT